MHNDDILKCLSDVINVEVEDLKKIDMSTPLFDIGLTSLLLVSFIVKIEETFEIEVLDSDLLLENFSTIEKMFQTLSKYFSESQQPVKKVLILDADNVLWRGISGEEPIEINRDVIEFQETLCDFYNRGVLLCLCSKNQSDLIERSFLSQEMRIKKSNFTVFLANRIDKATNIETIASELNLSPNSFVFADDSEYELGYVAAIFPEITCVKVDYSTLNFMQELISIFGGYKSTSELNRTQLYKEQKEREKEKRNYISVQEYNNSLQTIVSCNEAGKEDVERLSELSLRTHQFNLSDRQYSEEQITNMIRSPKYIVLSLSAKDKYGDMGIIGMAVMKNHIIEAFMLSCRAFDRDFELVLLNKIREYSTNQLCGIYKQTDKNKRYADFYKNNGVEYI